ncbi:MAG: hypothetical protein NT155_03775 [Candidatus Staskawiczbacteria bacterium]|nr:hypothetical protein [Candidatus Staskawiczbacteria bacterium]
MEQETKIEKWYETKITFLIATLTPLVIIMAFLFGMQKDIAVIQTNITNINTNHEVHIQDIEESIKDLQNQQVIQNNTMTDLQKQIIALLQSMKK